jgi:hypothetical protein
MFPNRRKFPATNPRQSSSSATLQRRRCTACFVSIVVLLAFVSTTMTGTMILLRTAAWRRNILGTDRPRTNAVASSQSEKKQDMLKQQHHQVKEIPDNNIQRVSVSQKKDQAAPPRNDYNYWRQLAVDLAQLSPDQTLSKLEHDDPFQVSAFEQALVATELKQGRSLKLAELRQLFACTCVRAMRANILQTTASCSMLSTCSTGLLCFLNISFYHFAKGPASRISLPDQRNLTRSTDFKRGQGFLFFQHLRKAGGTHFCSLAGTKSLLLLIVFVVCEIRI